MGDFLALVTQNGQIPITLAALAVSHLLVKRDQVATNESLEEFKDTVIRRIEKVEVDMHILGSESVKANGLVKEELSKISTDISWIKDALMRRN